MRGGAVRSESVRLALAAAGRGDPVLVHDAARPLWCPSSPNAVARGAAAAIPTLDGAIAAAPVSDTIKRVGAERGRVLETLDRSAPVGRADAAGVSPGSARTGARCRARGARPRYRRRLADRARGWQRGGRRVRRAELQGHDRRSTCAWPRWCSPSARPDPPILIESHDPVLSDLHLHLRPDDPDAPAERVLHARPTPSATARPPRRARDRRAGRLRARLPLRPGARDLAPSASGRAYAHDDLDAYCAFVREQTDLRLGLEVDYIPGREQQIAQLLERARLRLRRRLGALPRRRRRSTWTSSASGIRSPHEPPRRCGSATSRRSPPAPAAVCTTSSPTRTWSSSGVTPGRVPEGELRRYYEPAVEAFADSGVAVELSTAGLRKPAGEMYPAPAFLELCVQAGIPVALSSDAHRPAEVGWAYEQALELLERLGVRELAPLRGPRPHDGADRRRAARRVGTLTLVGIGYDCHRLVEGRPLVLGGVEIEHERGSGGALRRRRAGPRRHRRAAGGGRHGRHRRALPRHRRALAGRGLARAPAGGGGAAVRARTGPGERRLHGDHRGPGDLPPPRAHPQPPGRRARPRERTGEREGDHLRGHGLHRRPARARPRWPWPRSRRPDGGEGGGPGGERDRDPRHPHAASCARCGPSEGTLGIYACGPTVYSRIHIGNARPFVVFSLLRRLLVHEGYEVRLVVNITDVNDKIYDAAVAAGEPSAKLAERMIEAYRADTDALGLGRPDDEPLASETMDAIIDYIRTLIEGGHAYAADGDVYFRVRSDGQYGSLSHRRLQDMDQGEGVEGAERKQDPLDFALWKARKEGEDTWWDSPWGAGVRAGTSSARRWPSSCSGSASRSTAAARTCSSPTTRTRPPRRAPRGASELAQAVDAQRHGPADGREDGQVGRQHRAAARGARRPRRPRAGDVPDLRPLPPAARLLRGSARRTPPGVCDGSARRCAGWPPGEPSPAGHARAHAERSSPRCATTSTRPPRWPRWTGWIREANRRGGGRRRRAICARCSASSGWRAHPAAERRAGRRATPGAGADGGARAGPLGARLRGRRPHPRAAARAGLGGARRARGPGADSRRDPVRAQPGPRGAARTPGGQRGRDLGHRCGRARAVAARALAPRIVSAEEIERRCGSAAHQGVCAQAGPYPYAAAESLLGTGGQACWWRSTRSRTRRTSARSAAPPSAPAPAAS